LTYKYFISET